MGTHTYAKLEVGSDTYKEIKYKLEKAGYHQAFMDDGAIDMHGIGLVNKVDKERLIADFNERLKKKLDAIAQENGMTPEELMASVKKVLDDAHKMRESARIQAHGLSKGDDGDHD